MTGADNYYETKRDKYGNEYVPDDRSFYREATSSLGMAGDHQFASNGAGLQSTGYGSNMGLNVIEYNPNGPVSMEKVSVDVSRADRGRES